PVVGQGHLLYGVHDLLLDQFFSNEWLRAWFPPGTAQIIVFFLGFCGDGASTFTAAEEAPVHVGFQLSCLGLAPGFHRRLHCVKEFFGDNRLVYAFVKLTVITDEAEVDRIFE
ncbi:MAG: hypothetical protein Q8O46_02700, partial [bacterium]|nr:hypothetical protein [bacterium]